MKKYQFPILFLFVFNLFLTLSRSLKRETRISFSHFFSINFSNNVIHERRSMVYGNTWISFIHIYKPVRENIDKIKIIWESSKKNPKSIFSMEDFPTLGKNPESQDQKVFILPSYITSLELKLAPYVQNKLFWTWKNPSFAVEEEHKSVMSRDYNVIRKTGCSSECVNCLMLWAYFNKVAGLP